MPIYEYMCQKCHREFEELVFGSGSDVQCPDCASSDIKRLLSVTAIKTGSGFVASTSGGGGCSGCAGGSCHSCK